MHQNCHVVVLYAIHSCWYGIRVLLASIRLGVGLDEEVAASPPPRIVQEILGPILTVYNAMGSRHSTTCR